MEKELRIPADYGQVLVVIFYNNAVGLVVEDDEGETLSDEVGLHAPQIKQLIDRLTKNLEFIESNPL